MGCFSVGVIARVAQRALPVLGPDPGPGPGLSPTPHTEDGGTPTLAHALAPGVGPGPVPIPQTHKDTGGVGTCEDTYSFVI